MTEENNNQVGQETPQQSEPETKTEQGQGQELSPQDLEKVAGGTMNVQDWIGGENCGGVIAVGKPGCEPSNDGSVRVPERLPPPLHPR